jgi:hypothetical protein
MPLTNPVVIRPIRSFTNGVDDLPTIQLDLDGNCSTARHPHVGGEEACARFLFSRPGLA